MSNAVTAIMTYSLADESTDQVAIVSGRGRHAVLVAMQAQAEGNKMGLHYVIDYSGNAQAAEQAVRADVASIRARIFAECAELRAAMAHGLADE